jgi:glycine dehydrogenase subunit 1
MPYGPHTADDRARMLATIGIDSVDALFEDIPSGLRASPLRLDPPEPELELSARLAGLASRNRTDLASFLGCGAYRHWSPPVVDQLLLRGEWYTAYTPYQPEVSQGTLQSIYEYQSLLAELTGLDVVSASHYDGGAATAEAALMTCRATRRERLLVSKAVHPHYRATLATYATGAGLSIDEVPLVADGPGAGTTDLEALAALLADGTPVAGPADLRKALLSRSDAFLTTMGEKLLIYALGRPTHHYDMPQVRALARRAAASDNRFSAFVLGVVESDTFQKRVKK